MSTYKCISTFGQLLLTAIIGIMITKFFDYVAKKVISEVVEDEIKKDSCKTETCKTKNKQQS